MSVHDSYFYEQDIASLRRKSIVLFDVSMYESDGELLCVITKKEIRKLLKIPLLNLFRIRQYLHSERKFCRVWIKTNQPDADTKRSRGRLLNSMFNDFYSTYKYAHRHTIIRDINRHRLNEINDKGDPCKAEHKALEDIASPSSCNGCIHKPKQGENYYDPCGECKRFFGDYYTKTEEYK